MRKGESISLEIREVNLNGLVLYSYKKKENIFIDVSQLKAGFSKEKYQKLIGTPIVLRLISTRPKICVSEKFIHKDAPIFDDYALRPKDINPEIKNTTIQNIDKGSVTKMIQNKEIIITRENQFDKGWTLFRLCNLNIEKNRLYKAMTVSDVVKLITFSDKIDIILSEACLPTRVLDEIKWANKYTEVNLIAKSDAIIKRYSGILFSTVSIDKTINLNYIGVIGKQNGFFMIADGYVEIDDSIEKTYFQKKNLKTDYSFLDNVSQMLIVDSDGKLNKTELIKAAQKEKINCSYIVDVKVYNRQIFDYTKLNNVDLYVSPITKEGVILQLNNGDLRSLVYCNGIFLTYSISTILEFIYQEYKCCFYNDVVDTKKIKGTVFSCHNGAIQQLDIKDTKIVKIDIPISLMSDFVKEKFDSSIVDSHNDYSSEAEKVEYQFNLIPPLFDETYKESSIYHTVQSLIHSWNMIQTLKTEQIKKMYFDCLEEDFGIINLLDEGEMVTQTLVKRKAECDYKNYYLQIKATKELFEYTKSSLLDICKKMFNSINEKSSETKFDKFDNEIAGYRQTIEEKNLLIEKGIEVLSNKRRVEILSKKIDDLLKLKERFEGSSTTRNDKSASVFIQYCNNLLNGEKKQVNDDSIGNIVKPKDETKISKLESFVDTFLLSIKQYIDKSCEILTKLFEEVDMPEDYKVYDKGKERFIVINDLSEYESTKNICEKYNLKCIARR